LKNGARFSTLVDVSKEALCLAKENCDFNGIEADRFEIVNADVFEFLRKTDTHYDCIVLDPPKFAKHKGEVDRAARGYKDINLLAMKNIPAQRNRIHFLVFNAIDPYLFRQIVFAAARGFTAPVCRCSTTPGAGPDHPFNISGIGEGEYLKGLVLARRVISMHTNQAC